jgi:hypothetical protein
MLKTCCLFISFTVCLNLLGQISIPVTHMPTIGDVFTYARDTQVYTPKPLTAGVYDFSDLTQDDTTVFRYVANDKTVEFPNSNLKFTEDDNDQATVFFKKSGNDLFLISLSQVQQQLPIPGIGGLKGTMKYLTLPISTSTNITSSDEISTIIPKSLFQGFNIDSLASSLIPGATVDSLKITIKFSLNLFADGSGKIKTPVDNNIDVVKVIRKISIDPKLGLYGKAFGFPLNNIDITALLLGQLPIGNLNITSHTFYSPSFRQEIITATVDSTGKYQTVNYRYRTKNGVITNQIQTENNNNLEIDILNGSIVIKNLAFQQSAQLEVYALDGRKLQAKYISHKDSSLLLDKYTGARIIHLTSESGVLTKKIAIE